MQLEAVDELPEGSFANSSGFSPDVTNYEGTAYSSVNVIKVFPFTVSPTAKVEINGKSLTDGYIAIKIDKPGDCSKRNNYGKITGRDR